MERKIMFNGHVYVVRTNYGKMNINGKDYEGEIVSFWKDGLFVNHWLLTIHDKSPYRYLSIDEFLHEPDTKELVKAERFDLLSDMLLVFFKPTDCGRYGKIFEIVVKLYLNGYRGKSCIVSPKGKVDVKYKGQRIEVKSNCGELEDMSKSKYVIYSYDNVNDVKNPAECGVTNTEDFLSALEGLNLIRQNKKTTGGRIIKSAIQSYKNSKRKYTAWSEKVDSWERLKNWK